MKKGYLKRILIALLSVCLVAESFTMVSAKPAEAADTLIASNSTEEAKPDQVTFTAKVTAEGNGVKFTIGKTANAEGCKVYMKGPGATKYKLIKTVAKSGTSKRIYTKKNLENGIYCFKIRAYRVVDGAKVYGKYSKIATVEINVGPAPGDAEDDDTKYADITFKNGYAYFGSYPQTGVTDQTLISKINKANDGRSMVVTVDGVDYIYNENIKKWCKSEPVEWIILEGSATSDSVTLMSNKVLLECGYSSWDGYKVGGTWKDSFVRNHLNGYNGKFNSIWSFDFFGVIFKGDTQRVLMRQTYGDCEDLVLLPSKARLSKMSASERIRKASDLALKADKQGYWCIDSDGKGNITLVNPKGEFTTHAANRQDGEGYVPVIKVNLKKCNIITE